MNRRIDWFAMGCAALVFVFVLPLAVIMWRTAWAEDVTDAPTCWSAVTEDSAPVKVPCDYRDGAWFPTVSPVTLPPCDDAGPGRPITGTCWLADDGTVAVWPHPYADRPLYVLQGSR